MNLDLKDLIEKGNISRMERIEKVLRGVQDFYCDELIKTKEKLDNMKNILELASMPGETKIDGK